MSIRRIFFGLLLVTSTSPLGAGENVAMKVFPVVSFAPAYLRVRATIETNADNRAIEVVAESPDFYRSSMNELNGERAPRTTVFQLQNLPGGRYEVTTRLFGPSGQIRALIHSRCACSRATDRADPQITDLDPNRYSRRQYVRGRLGNSTVSAVSA